MNNHKTGGKPVKDQAEKDETHLLKSLYDGKNKKKKFNDEEENQKKFYKPLD